MFSEHTVQGFTMGAAAGKEGTLYQVFSTYNYCATEVAAQIAKGLRMEIVKDTMHFHMESDKFFTIQPIWLKMDRDIAGITGDYDITLAGIIGEADTLQTFLNTIVNGNFKMKVENPYVAKKIATGVYVLDVRFNMTPYSRKYVSEMYDFKDANEEILDRRLVLNILTGNVTPSIPTYTTRDVRYNLMPIKAPANF